MKKEDKDIEIALSKIRRLRLIASLLFAALLVISFVSIIIEIPEMYKTF